MGGTGCNACVERDFVVEVFGGDGCEVDVAMAVVQVCPDLDIDDALWSGDRAEVYIDKLWTVIKRRIKICLERDLIFDRVDRHTLRAIGGIGHANIIVSLRHLIIDWLDTQATAYGV